MFEQVKHNLETIDGVATFPIISLVIFFFFFVGLGLWVFSYKKERIDELSQMPLQDNKIV